MNSFDNCISENFLKTYYNDIIFNDVLYSNFKKYSPLFFLLTVIKLSIDTGIISNVGISSESFVNTNFNKQFEKAVEDNLTNITITNLFNAYSSVAYSPFGYVFSFEIGTCLALFVIYFTNMCYLMNNSGNVETYATIIEVMLIKEVIIFRVISLILPILFIMVTIDNISA